MLEDQAATPAVCRYAAAQVALHPGCAEVPHHDGPIEAADYWWRQAFFRRGHLAAQLAQLEADAREPHPPAYFRQALARAELQLHAARAASAFSAAYLTHGAAWCLESGACLALFDKEKPGRVARIVRLQRWLDEAAAQLQRARDEVERATQAARREGGAA